MAIPLENRPSQTIIQELGCKGLGFKVCSEEVELHLLKKAGRVKGDIFRDVGEKTHD